MIVELLDLSSVRRLLCSWLVVGEFGWTVMLSTAISSSYMEVQKLQLDWFLLAYASLHLDLRVIWLKEAFQFIAVNSPLTVVR